MRTINASCEQHDFRVLLLFLNISLTLNSIQDFKCGKPAQIGLGATLMAYKRSWIIAICLGLLLVLTSSAMAQDMTKKDLRGISPKHHKYIFSVLGGAAAGAGLGFILGGGAKTAKLAMLGGGGASTWFLHTHRDSLGDLHDWGMIGSNTVLGMGAGWTICDCHNGLVAGALLGGGATAAWEALKHDSATQNALNQIKP